ncbi:gliding motility lipoprotein GldH [Pedobacter xixiisoli]|uniref:Gliding motility-associated lipoprotein GldH n=1 Tax=Pedobacter xixiisoli TaxID=1476464 RepID=A0A286ADP9_9SPHI|nr:gliding motility lipoprotein GldH [Pedobacter xixiisoli]SOD20038.1 gliding motility-associated lipoprotein GldH [Pedobacter xixiisoli]
MNKQLLRNKEQVTLKIGKTMRFVCPPSEGVGGGFLANHFFKLQVFAFFCVLFTFSSCNFNTVVDTNQTIEDNQWLYANVAKAEFEINDVAKPYQVNFKLRINSEYRYSNLFVLATFKDAKSRKKTRYQFKLAKADGQWLGKGSGDLYTYSFPLLKNHRFADTGKYSIEIEQNMRDNPLVGISDVGIEVK